MEKYGSTFNTRAKYDRFSILRITYHCLLKSIRFALKYEKYTSAFCLTSAQQLSFLFVFCCDWQKIEVMHSNWPALIKIITVQLYGGADCYACCRFLLLPLLLLTAIFPLLLIHLKFTNYHVNEFYDLFCFIAQTFVRTYIY